MSKSKQKIDARHLRKQGISIKKIAKQISVSVSSVSVWCRDISFTEEEKKKMFRDGYIAGSRARFEAIERRKEAKRKEIVKLHQMSKKEVGTLTQRELFLVGIALYWGEGFKKDSLVGLANTSPSIIRFYIRWLQSCFQITKKELIVRITINCEREKETERIERYWSEQLNIPRNQFSKCYYQQTKLKKEYEDAEGYKGVIRIKVRRSISLLRKIEGYIYALEDESLKK